MVEIKRMIGKNNIVYKTHKKIKEAISARKKVFIWQLKGRPIPPPHAVKQNIVKSYAAKFSLRNFIETGTYMGEMIDAVLNTFSKITSIEFGPALTERAKNRFSSYSHVKIIQGDSGQVLPEVMANINEPCLFWLDAHYSGGVTAKNALETPIVKELSVLLEYSCPDHVILINDAREFTGQNNYPLLEEVRNLIAAKHPDWIMQVKDDVIRIHKTVF
jgi:hypothetical protein